MGRNGVILYVYVVGVCVQGAGRVDTSVIYSYHVAGGLLGICLLVIIILLVPSSCY